MIRDQQITDKLADLGVTEDATPDRLPLPGADFKACIHLRGRGMDARYSQTRLVTVPATEHDEALIALAMVEQYGSDWIAEGRRLLDLS